MQKIIAIAIVALFALVAMPTGEAGGSKTTHYATVSTRIAAAEEANPAVQPAVSCDEGGHGYTPTDDPEEFIDSDPTDPANFSNDALGWAISGEPECLPTDVVFGTEQSSGIGGQHLAISDDDVGQSLTAVVTDGTFDTTALSVSGTTEDPDDENLFEWGCVSVTVTIPEGLERHWQSTVTDPMHLMWVRMYAAHVDAAGLGTCFGSTGTVTTTWGAI